METLEENIIRSLGKEEGEKLLSTFKEDSYHSFWFNEEKVSKEILLSLYPNLKEHPYINNAFIYNKNEYDLGKSYLHDLGAIYIQDASSQMNVYFLNPKPGENVLDMCSAPGGKALLASYKMKNKGYLIANDISFPRLKEELSNIERMGSSNILLINNDFTNLDISKINKFHKIILDAPCSGSGMIRKDPKMKDDWSYNKVVKFQEIQKSLILKAFDLLLPGGKMCYSTCSFSIEENEDVIEYLLQNRDARIVEIDKKDDFYINDKKPYGVHFLPSKFLGEGQYCCLIEKEGSYEIKEDKDSFLLDFNDLKNRCSLLFNDHLYSLPIKCEYKQFHVLRYGLEEKEIIKGIEKPSYHLSHALKNYDQVLELNDEDFLKYKKGDVIFSNLKGWVLLKYRNIPFSFGKGDGIRIKNHLPKGLRN